MTSRLKILPNESLKENKMKLFTIIYTIFLILSIQGCNEDNPHSCNCDKTDFVLDFIDKDGEIYYIDDTYMKGWVISVKSEDNSQILIGIICNANSPYFKTITKDIPSESPNKVPVIFSGRVTQLCPDEIIPIHPSNVSFYYLKIDTITL
jgi:hypothetical protein